MPTGQSITYYMLRVYISFKLSLKTAMCMTGDPISRSIHMRERLFVPRGAGNLTCQVSFIYISTNASCKERNLCMCLHVLPRNEAPTTPIDEIYMPTRQFRSDLISVYLHTTSTYINVHIFPHISNPLLIMTFRLLKVGQFNDSLLIMTFIFKQE